jgi:hypothetical protein
MKGYSWTCPHCERPVTITSNDKTVSELFLNSDNVEGRRFLRSTFIVCPNPECKKFTLLVEIGTAKSPSGPYGLWKMLKQLQAWQLIPSSKAKVFPDYIPKAILEDYNEACLIMELSPRASATLARRCLQGIIRDFWQVKAGNLADEINQIEDKVETLTWKAIKAVKSVGNIGAHMEKDVNLIVDIEPNEAKRLIGLIETLLVDWYVARHDKETRLKALVELGEEKEVARKPKKTETESTIS